MDNPVSWFILLCLVIIVGIWFTKKALDELEAKKHESGNWATWGK